MACKRALNGYAGISKWRDRQHTLKSCRYEGISLYVVQCRPLGRSLGTCQAICNGAPRARTQQQQQESRLPSWALRRYGLTCT